MIFKGKHFPILLATLLAGQKNEAEAKTKSRVKYISRDESIISAPVPSPLHMIEDMMYNYDGSTDNYVRIPNERVLSKRKRKAKEEFYHMYDPSNRKLQKEGVMLGVVGTVKEGVSQVVPDNEKFPSVPDVQNVNTNTIQRGIGTMFLAFTGQGPFSNIRQDGGLPPQTVSLNSAYEVSDFLRQVNVGGTGSGGGGKSNNRTTRSKGGKIKEAVTEKIKSGNLGKMKGGKGLFGKKGGSGGEESAAEGAAEDTGKNFGFGKDKSNKNNDKGGATTDDELVPVDVPAGAEEATTTMFPTLAPLPTNTPTTLSPSHFPTLSKSPSNSPTSSPTLLPTDFSICGTGGRSRNMQFFMGILQDIHGNDAVIMDKLLNVTTTESQAMCWLVQEGGVDPLAPNLREAYGLAYLYTQLGGSNWKNHTNWGTHPDLCKWFGIECAEGVIESIKLPRNRLTGSMPSEIGMLQDVKTIELYTNRIGDVLPAELWNLPKLESVDFYNNRLSGEFPIDAVNATNLKQLFLSRNNLVGQIPTHVGNMTNLKDLWIARNYMTGTIPSELGAMSSLESLIGYENLLTGSLPRELGNSSTLIWIDVFGNDLTGELPEELYKVPSMKSIYLSGNSLSGTLSTSIGGLTSLTDLWLDDNQFTGTLPDEMGQITGLKSLYLNSNKFTGSLPSSVGNMKNLAALDVTGNQLNGTIAEEFYNASQLRNLFLSENEFTGTISSKIGDLSSLVVLWLNGNKFSGTIPQEIQNIYSLEKLYLNNNNFTGAVSTEICLSLTSIEVFSVDCTIDCSCCTQCF